MNDWAFSMKRNQTSPKSAKKVICSCPLGLYYTVLFISRPCVPSFSRRGKAIHCRPSVDCRESIDILCMYYILLLLMTDKYTEHFILLHFSHTNTYVYTQIYLYKMFTIRFFILFCTFFEWLSERSAGSPEILQECVSAICLYSSY